MQVLWTLSPNLVTITKFDEIVKIGGCTQLSNVRPGGLLQAAVGAIANFEQGDWSADSVMCDCVKN